MPIALSWVPSFLTQRDKWFVRISPPKGNISRIRNISKEMFTQQAIAIKAYSNTSSPPPTPRPLKSKNSYKKQHSGFAGRSQSGLSCAFSLSASHCREQSALRVRNSSLLFSLFIEIWFSQNQPGDHVYSSRCHSYMTQSVSHSACKIFKHQYLEFCLHERRIKQNVYCRFIDIITLSQGLLKVKRFSTCITDEHF